MDIEARISESLSICSKVLDAMNTWTNPHGDVVANDVVNGAAFAMGCMACHVYELRGKPMPPDGPITEIVGYKVEVSNDGNAWQHVAWGTDEQVMLGRYRAEQGNAWKRVRMRTVFALI